MFRSSLPPSEFVEAVRTSMESGVPRRYRIFGANTIVWLDTDNPSQPPPGAQPVWSAKARFTDSTGDSRAALDLFVYAGDASCLDVVEVKAFGGGSHIKWMRNGLLDGLKAKDPSFTAV